MARLLNPEDTAEPRRRPGSGRFSDPSCGFHAAFTEPRRCSTKESPDAERAMPNPTCDGCNPFDEQYHGHLPDPPWVVDQAAPVTVEEATASAEPELDPPHHVHDLWIALGLGEE
jgi:hypothetical protein